MTEDEQTISRAGVAELLALAAAYDQRTVGETDVEAWWLALGDGPLGANIRAGDAKAALVEHYQDDTRRIMPADICQRVAEWREEWSNRNLPPGTVRPVHGTERLLSPDEMTPAQYRATFGGDPVPAIGGDHDRG